MRSTKWGRPEDVAFLCAGTPTIYLLAGPNGAGKTTFAREFLPRK